MVLLVACCPVQEDKTGLLVHPCLFALLPLFHPQGSIGHPVTFIGTYFMLHGGRGGQQGTVPGLKWLPVRLGRREPLTGGIGLAEDSTESWRRAPETPGWAGREAAWRLPTQNPRRALCHLPREQQPGFHWLHWRGAARWQWKEGVLWGLSWAPERQRAEPEAMGMRQFPSPFPGNSPGS